MPPQQVKCCLRALLRTNRRRNTVPAETWTVSSASSLTIRVIRRPRADGHGWYAPELLRIKGEVLLRQAADQSALAAEDCFNQAAQMARAQGALFWELRVALSVARLRVSQGRHREARAPLASVYDRFTEGFATADLQTARTMLEGLP